MRTQRTLGTPGLAPGHVSDHAAEPGLTESAGHPLHTRMEPGDYRHLCPDRAWARYIYIYSDKMSRCKALFLVLRLDKNVTGWGGGRGKHLSGFLGDTEHSVCMTIIRSCPASNSNP